MFIAHCKPILLLQLITAVSVFDLTFLSVSNLREHSVMPAYIYTRLSGAKYIGKFVGQSVTSFRSGSVCPGLMKIKILTKLVKPNMYLHFM